MGKALAKKIGGMNLRTKICVVFMLLAGIFLYQGILKPLIGDTATNTYYFTTDNTAVNLVGDGNTSTAATVGGKISMKTGVYATSRSVTAASVTTEQRMISAYSPVYTTKQTLTAPAVTIGVRDRNGTANAIYWKAYVYKYNPAVAPGAGKPTNVGAANNATLLWTSNEMESHPSVQTPLEMTFSNPQPRDIEAGYRVKVVITARLANTASSARLYWGNSTNYSFFTVTEAPYVANSLTVTNLSDYYGGALVNVTQGDTKIPMLQFDLYSNVTPGSAIWTGGKLDKIGTNTSVWLNIDEPGDVSFSIYKDADGDGAFEATDTLIGGPYNFNQLTAQAYTLTTAQTITVTPQRYFITYSIRNNATSNTTVGARIVPDGTNSYFTVTGASGGVINVASTSSSQPNIQYGGTAMIKNYPADWDSGTSLAGIVETGGPGTTDSTCITRTTAGSGFPLVGLLNYPAHSCTSVAGQNYSNTSGSTQADFIRLYFGGSGYHSNMLSVKGRSLAYRVYTPGGGGTVTLQLFYVTSAGVRVNSPITSKYTTTNNTSQTITTSLAGQNFIGTAEVPGVPLGARLGIQIGVTAGMQIGLGKAVNAQLQVEETAAENENVDVGNGFPTANANVYAGDTGKVINSFTLTSSKPLASAKIVNSITIKGSTLFNSTNVKTVKIYSDSPSVGTLGVVDGTDTLIGSTTTITGTSATVPVDDPSALVNGLQAYTTVKRYLVVVDIGDIPNTNIILSALVDDLSVATTGTVGENIDSSSSTLTILPTTTLEDATAEPPNVILPSGAGVTKLDAFRIKTNGGINDTFSNIKVTLSTTSTLPAGKVISDYVSRMDIVTTAGASLGHLTTPTIGNDWQVTTTGLAATTTPTDYYVAITPKPGQSMTYNVKAKVISIVHSRTTNRLLLNDALTATIIMDQLAPTEPSLTAVTGTYDEVNSKARINLDWIGSTDLSGAAVNYILVRGQGNAPPPINCKTDNVKSFLVYQGTALSYIDNNFLDEGVSYGYRVCAIDSVGNTSAGSAKSTTASIKNRCSELPEITIDPMASYVKAGNAVAMGVNITNKDTGSCPATTFTLSIIGANPNDSNFDIATFAGNNFSINTNNGSQYTTLNTTAKQGAVQGATKTFHVAVTKSTGGQTQCPDPIYVVVNKYGTMMHSSLQVGTKYGSWGLSYDCSTCHSPTATNIKQVKNTISTPNGNRAVAFSIISTTPTANVAGVYGNDNRTGTVSSNVCEVCHHNARFHQYSASKIAWTGHNNNKDCTSCHPHSIGFKSVAAAGSCDSCHGNPPTTQATLVAPPTNVLFPYATNAGSHAKHDERGLACKTCHNNGNHIGSSVPVGDKLLNMGFRINNSNFNGFVGNMSSAVLRALPPGNNYQWNGTAGLTLQQAPNTIMTCNVYCHGWDDNYGYNTEPAWTGISQVGCGSCHAATNDIPPRSGSHHKHASNEPGFGNGIACSKCHGYRNYSTSSAHINGNVEWDLSTLPPGTLGLALYRGSDINSTGNPAPTAPGSYGSCENLYCHSNVQTNNGTSPPDRYATPQWGMSTNCGSCHDEPNVSGGHPQHTGAGVTGFDCRICHGSGGDANPLNHANEKIDFLFGGLADNTHYSFSSAKVAGSGAYGTCYNSNCHGRRPKGDLTWGPANAAIPLCDKCHSTNTFSAGFYGTAGPNGTKSKTDPYVGAHFQHITSMPYKLAAKYDCDECHYKPEGPYTPGHMDTALPAELTFGATASSGTMNGYTSASHQPGYNFGARQCSNIWCHGSGMMSVEGTGLYGSALDDGAPANASRVAAPVWNSPFLAGTTADCKKCHDSPPPAPLPGYNHWDDDNNRAYQSNQCITCHKHVNAAGSGFSKPDIHANGVVDSCLNCHGLPPVDDNSLTKPAINALGEGMVGAHQAHFLNPTIGKRCNICHYNYSGDMPSYKLEIGFNAYGGKVSRGTFYGYSTLTNSYSQPIVYFSTRSSTTVRRTDNKDSIDLKTCQNLYCHGGGINAATALQGGSNVKPNWEAGASQAECGACHGVTGATYNARGSHGAHVGTGYGELGLACSICHGIKENNYHVDGQVEWQFYGTTAQGLNLPATSPQYTPAAGNGTAGISGKTNGLAPSASYGTCTVYCHSNGHGVYASPVWGGPKVDCGSCHKNQTSDWTYGNADIHKIHTTTYGIDCLVCHDGSGFASTKHINGAFDIAFNKSIVGPLSAWDNTSKKCFSVLCHDSTASTGPTWTAGSTDGRYETGAYQATCIGCHSGQVNTRAAVIPQFAGESHHIQGVAISNSYCYPCHMEANATGTVNTAYHDRSANKTVDLVIWGAGARGAVFTKYSANGSAARKRTEYAKVNNQCISCHRTSNNAITPFSAIGDNRTPKTYSWDTYSIFSRYSGGAADVTPWGKYSDTATTMVSPKNTQSKAYSAHGRADLNQRGWNTTETWPNTSASATAKVMCFDCHNSHGTTASGVMSSYSSATGRYKGGILKSTVENVGGYGATYTPMAGGDSAAPNKNAYNPGAALCFDCHNNAAASTAVPWGYNSTFGATQGIYGYNDKPNFGNYSVFGPSIRYSYKKSNDTNKGGHFGASSTLGTAAMKPVNGLCTPCHDPHGVSPSLGGNKQYGVPLLRGTWMTSFYQEDAAPANSQEIRGGQNDQGTGDSGGNANRPQRQRVGSTPGYRIDQNTLGPQVNTNQPNYGTAQSAPSWTFTNATRATQTDAQFAGLCTGCHTKASLAPKAGQAVVPDAWKSTSRIHGAVKGWATTQSASDKNFNNTVHSFTCAKCHTPHNAKLPRLMVSNCLDYQHRGRVASGGTVAATASVDNASGLATTPGAGYASVTGEKGSGKGRFPAGGEMMTNNSKQQNPGQWFFGLDTGNAFFSCHDGANGNSGTYPNSQLWNSKTPW